MAVIFQGEVVRLLISETSTFATDNGDEARKGRNTESWRSSPNRQRRSASKKARLLWQKKIFRNFLLYQHISDFCCRPLCIAPVQLLCEVIADWPLRAAGKFGICMTHTCSERLLVGKKAKLLIFAGKRESCFPKVEHTWNWNVRRTKAALRHWKRENWNIFQNIWKKSNTPQGSVFLEWTIVTSWCMRTAKVKGTPLPPDLQERSDFAFSRWTAHNQLKGRRLVEENLPFCQTELRETVTATNSKQGAMHLKEMQGVQKALMRDSNDLFDITLMVLIETELDTRGCFVDHKRRYLARRFDALRHHQLANCNGNKLDSYLYMRNGWGFGVKGVMSTVQRCYMLHVWKSVYQVTWWKCQKVSVWKVVRVRSYFFIHLAAPSISAVVVPGKESPHVPNNKRNSGCCRACHHPVRGCTILAHWLASEKDGPCCLFKLLLVKLSAPVLGLVVVAALSLMSTSLQRNVSCSSSASRAYASFLTTGTESQRAGVVVRLKEQQSTLFPHRCFPIMVRRDPKKISNSRSFNQRWADAVTIDHVHNSLTRRKTYARTGCVGQKIWREPRFSGLLLFCVRWPLSLLSAIVGTWQLTLLRIFNKSCHGHGCSWLPGSK